MSKRSLMGIAILSLVFLVSLALVACGGGGDSREEVKEAGEEFVVDGPYLRLQPGIGGAGILVVDGDGRGGRYGMSFDNSSEAQGLPEGYFLPRKVEIYSIPTGADPRIRIYRVILGQGLTPGTPDNVVYVTLSEEFWVGPLKKGLTQVFFE